MELQRSFWMPKRGKPCLSIQITPETTNNHLPFAYCSFVAHTHENSSQFYLGSIYCNKVCNPLKYKSFPYNPRLYKPRQIFHTFLSHQQEIALTSLTDIRIFRSACHMFTNVSPQELLTLTVSLRRPSLPMLSPPHRRVSSSSSTWILERGKYWLLESQTSFAASSIRLNFQCFARRMVSLCSFCLGLQNSFSGLWLIKIQYVLHNFWTLFLWEIWGAAGCPSNSASAPCQDCSFLFDCKSTMLIRCKTIIIGF